MSTAARGGLGVAWLAFAAVLGALYLTVPPSPDQSQFDWMAFAATRGQPFYAGSFDMNWPGAMWLHEAGIRLFGVHAWTWRLTDFLLMLGFTGAGGLFLARAGWPAAGGLFGFLYPPLYITAGAWMAGQRDIVAAGFLLVACALSQPRAVPSRAGGMAAFAAGLAVAAAVLIRPTYLSFIAGLLVLEALPLKADRAGGIGRAGRAWRLAAGLALGLAAAALVGLALGNLDDWYRQSVTFALSVYTGDPPQERAAVLADVFVRSWHWIVALAGVGLVIWLRRDGPSHALVLVLGIAATGAVSFVVQGKNFGYHLGGILPALVLLAAVALAALIAAARRTGGPWRIAAAGLACALALAGTAAKLTRLEEGAGRLLAGGPIPTAGFGLSEAERRRIVALIREGSGPGDTVAVYGTRYDLPYRAERLPAYRFFTPTVDQIRPGFPHYDSWMAEIDTALAETPPAFVLVEAGSVPDRAGGAAPGGPIRARLLTHLARDHVVVFDNGVVVLYRHAP